MRVVHELESLIALLELSSGRLGTSGLSEMICDCCPSISFVAGAVRETNYMFTSQRYRPKQQQKTGHIDRALQSQ